MKINRASLKATKVFIFFFFPQTGKNFLRYRSVTYTNMILQLSAAVVCHHLVFNSHNQALIEGLLGLLVKTSVFALLMLPTLQIYYNFFQQSGHIHVLLSDLGKRKKSWGNAFSLFPEISFH